LQETDSMTGASGSSTVSTGSSAGTGDSSASSSALPIEVQKGDPEGPPPILIVGDDDIYWVSKLHDGLQTAGFYPADEEVREWFDIVVLYLSSSRRGTPGGFACAYTTLLCVHPCSFAASRGQPLCTCSCLD
jgi:hypothetical protein